MPNRQNVVPNRHLAANTGLPFGVAAAAATEREINAAELQRMSAEHGFPDTEYPRLESLNTGLIKGSWSLFGEADGLSMHCGEFEEIADVAHSLELPAGLSISVIFAGEVNFALGDQQHAMRAGAGSAQAGCFALCKPETLTRQLRKGQQVSKVTVFVERNWLLKRAQSLASRAQLQQLFCHHGQLSHWRPGEKLVQICRDLLQARPAQCLSQQIAQESAVLSLLAAAIEQWGLALNTGANAAVPAAVVLIAEKVKQSIDQVSATPTCLQQLAEAHNVSVSSLQRHFKHCYGITVIRYMRQQQLLRAREALVGEGLSIGEVAYLAGYSHVGNFITAFTKAFGISPANCRAAYSAAALSNS